MALRKEHAETQRVATLTIGMRIDEQPAGHVRLGLPGRRQLAGHVQLPIVLRRRRRSRTRPTAGAAGRAAAAASLCPAVGPVGRHQVPAMTGFGFRTLRRL